MVAICTRTAWPAPLYRRAQLAPKLLSRFVPAATFAGPGTNGIIAYFIA
jgi:hypothetical protein